MSEPRYDTSVDLSNENMSQSLLVRLVGDDRDVLDVGCATGYTAQALRAQGCRVVGLEPDAEAAAQAAEHVDRLFVATVEEADLASELGAASMDAVVFGDVLEHLVDPVATLRAVEPLLRPDGMVVASIPHVAHGAVRLALLAGRFTYTPTGLLDETHLRFFTLEQVHRTFAEAGFEVVRVRRTTLGLFQTEVAVGEGDHPADVVDRVLDDPESQTYQFVVAAVRADRVTDAQRGALADAEQQRLEEHRAARASAPRRRAASAAARATGPQVGVWCLVDGHELEQSLRVRVVQSELAHRLPSVVLRPASAYGPARPELGDLAAEPLGALGEHRAHELAATLDAVVVLGDVLPDAAAAAARYGDGLRPDHPALWLTQGAPGQVVTVRLPDDDHELLSLVPDLVTAPAARLRVDRLVDQGILPPAPAGIVVVQGGPDELEAVPDLVAALAVLVDGGALVVPVEASQARGDAAFALEVAQAVGRADEPGAGRSTVLGAGTSLEDLVSVVAAADLVVTSAPGLTALAAGYGVPVVGHREVPGVLPNRTDRPDPDILGRAAAAARLDAVAEQLVDAGRERSITEVGDRVVALEAALAAARVRVQALPPITVDTAPEVLALTEQVAELAGQLQTLNNTRVMRALRPARSVYGRLRAARGR